LKELLDCAVELAEFSILKVITTVVWKVDAFDVMRFYGTYYILISQKGPDVILPIDSLSISKDELFSDYEDPGIKNLFTRILLEVNVWA
jgi:hypothetical protein